MSKARAIRRAPFLIARDELLMVIDARDTASTSAPTLNGSRMSLPLNCWANCGGSTESENRVALRELLKSAKQRRPSLRGWSNGPMDRIRAFLARIFDLDY